MLTQPAGGHPGRLALEVLEGRSLPAAPFIPIPTVGQDTGIIVQALVQPVPTAGTLPTQALPTAAAPAPGQLPVGSLLWTYQSAWGFAGRIVFPGTDLQIRSATGPGPMTQPPGLFPAGGGGGAQPEVPAAEEPQVSEAAARSEPADTGLIDQLFEELPSSPHPLPPHTVGESR